MKKRFLLVIIALSLLVSCGGGGGGNGGGPNPTPTPTYPSTEEEGTTPEVTVPVPKAPDVYFNTNDPHNVKSVRNAGYDGTGVTVGIVDTGFNETHSEFKNSAGVSRLNKDSSFPGNANTHGTFVAEVIGGKNAGIAPNVKMEAVSAGASCDDGSNGCIETTRAMYDALYSKGVRIFNQSFGEDAFDMASATKTNFPEHDPVVNFYKVRAASDSLFIWATGNASSTQPSPEAGLPYLYPEMEKGWIAVTAVDSKTGLTSDYANNCGLAMNWCISAVGDYDFYTEWVRGYGTSYATPAVTGAAALLQQKFSWMDASLIRQTLLSTATDKGDLGVDNVYGWGLLNIEKALKGPALFDQSLALSTHVVANVTSGTYYFENNISGNAGLIKNGSGELRLTGTNTYTGTNIVNAGNLYSSGKLVSSVTISPRATFTSNGSYIGDSVINQGGTFVNEGEGTIITGDYLSTSDSVLESDSNSTINVKGKAVLANSQLKIRTPRDENNNPVYISSVGSANKIIIAENGIENGFNNVDSPLLIKSTITYSSDNVELNVERANVSEYTSQLYNSDATRDNSAENLEQVFTALDNTNGNESFRTKAAILQQTASASALATTLDSLSGQIYASAQALTFQQTQTINKDLSNRLSILGSLNHNENAGLWFNMIGSSGKLYESGYAKADTSLYGAQMGVDKTFNNLILGIAVAFSESKADFNRYAGESKSQSLGVSLYGRYGFNDNLYILGRFGGSYISSDVERDVIIGPTKENISIEHDDYSFSGYGEVGYTLKTPMNLTVTPFAALSYDNVKRGNFSEDNSLFGLKAESKNYDQTSGLLGLKAETDVIWAAGRTIFQSYATWQRAFNDEDLSFEASYVGLGGQKFKVKGIGLAKNTVWTGIGALTEVTPTWSWYVNYDMQIQRSRVMNNVFSVGARINLN